MTLTSLAKAKALALIVPLGLLAGAYGFQYVWDDLYPCEMCWWQRWAHFAALPFALAALVAGARLNGGRIFVGLAALAIFASGAIGVWHAGIELHLIPGATSCSTTTTSSAGDLLRGAFDRPIIRCDEVQWRFLGVSMAGWNAIVSILGAAAILWLSRRRSKAAA